MAISGAVYGIKRSLYNDGYKACQEKYLEQLRKHNESVRSRIVSMEERHKKELSEVNNIGDNSDVGPAVTRALDLML
jgi:hypothetical protein